MRDQILQSIRAYVADEINIGALESAVIPILWETDDEATLNVIHRVAAELCMVKDGVLYESEFRARMIVVVNRSLAAAG